MNDRWSIGSDGFTILRNGQLVGMALSREIAGELVILGNEAAPNDREAIANALGNEANRLFQKQEPEYPSNILDILSNNIRHGKTDKLLVPPRGMEKHLKNNVFDGE